MILLMSPNKFNLKNRIKNIKLKQIKALKTNTVSHYIAVSIAMSCNYLEELRRFDRKEKAQTKFPQAAQESPRICWVHYHYLSCVCCQRQVLINASVIWELGSEKVWTALWHSRNTSSISAPSHYCVKAPSLGLAYVFISKEEQWLKFW